MTASSPLHYGSRFGNKISQIARTSTPLVNPSEDPSASAKYSRWFFGEDGTPEPWATSQPKFKKITAGMVAAEIAAATKENLSILGEDTNALFLPRLPKGHRLRESIRSSVLAGAPHLGTCKFAEIVTSREGEAIAVTQMFIANFEGEIDTSDPQKLYLPSTPEFRQMFFGLHLLLNRQGEFLSIDRKRGRDGVAFKTRSISTAFSSIASASTGLSINALMARATATRKK